MRVWPAPSVAITPNVSNRAMNTVRSSWNSLEEPEPEPELQSMLVSSCALHALVLLATITDILRVVYILALDASNVVVVVIDVVVVLLLLLL